MTACLPTVWWRLLDFGGAGTSITLADAAAGFTPIADTVRYPEFSGDLIDQALLVHVLENVGHTKGADPASTGVVGQFGNLREECRLAKERLSDETETELVVELSGQRATVQVSRAELESLIEDRLSGVLSAFDDMLRRSRVRRRDLAAVAMAGGVAKIPLVAQRLSAHAKASVVTAVQPGLAMAVGAVMLSARQPVEQQEDELESTTMAAMVGASTGSFAGVYRHFHRIDRHARCLHRHVRRTHRRCVPRRPVGDDSPVGLVGGRRLRQRTGGLYR